MTFRDKLALAKKWKRQGKDKRFFQRSLLNPKEGNLLWAIMYVDESWPDLQVFERCFRAGYHAMKINPIILMKMHPDKIVAYLDQVLR
jgi:hypothetical protein